jgi:hypothetical protein
MREHIEAAMKVLVDASCGGVGAEGPTLSEMEEIWDSGNPAGGDAYYDTCQHAYRLLEQALENDEPRDGGEDDPVHV